MIYYRQGDMNSFEQLSDEHKFLAMFLLGNRDEMDHFHPPDYNQNLYLQFKRMLNGDKIDQNNLDKMLRTMAQAGNMKGLKYFEAKGATILAAEGETDMESPLSEASTGGNVEMVKYLVEHGADIHFWEDTPLINASYMGHLDIVKYLLEQGANVNAKNNAALIEAARGGRLNLVKYLAEEHNADIHGQNDDAFRQASMNGHLDIVKYLVEHGVDFHSLHGRSLRRTRDRGHKDVLNYIRNLKIIS